MQTSATSFRPLQGLTIMNMKYEEKAPNTVKQFPSPTGGVSIMNFVAYAKILLIAEFPSPTGGKHYE